MIEAQLARDLEESPALRPFHLAVTAENRSKITAAATSRTVMRTGPVGSMRRASTVSGAEPSLARQPWISFSPSAGTPSAGTVTVPPPLT